MPSGQKTSTSTTGVSTTGQSGSFGGFSSSQGTNTLSGSQTQSGSSTTLNMAPVATNSSLNSLYNSIFKGGGNGATGLGQGAASTLTGVMNGTTLNNNIGQLFSSLQNDSSTAYQQGLAQIKAQGGASGTRFSTDTNAQIGSYSNNYIQNLNSTATNMGLSELGVQSNTAQGILGQLGTSANQYYNPGSKTQNTQNGQQTQVGTSTQQGVTGGSSSQMSNTTQQQNSTSQQQQTGLNAWLDPIFNVIGGAAGIAGLFM